MKRILIILVVLLSISCVSTKVSTHVDKEEVIAIGLKELDLDVNIILVDLQPRLHNTERGYELNGVVSSFGENTYKIKLRTGMTSTAIISTIAHELIHVRQYHTGQLRQTSMGTVTYKGKKYKHERLVYKDKLWESDAYLEGRTLSWKIRRILKQKQ